MSKEVKFWNACCTGNSNEVKRLVTEGGFDINWRSDTGKTGFIIACEEKYSNVVRILLSVSNIDVNSKDETGLSALEYALRGSHYKTSMLLLQDPRLNVFVHTMIENISMLLVLCSNSRLTDSETATLLKLLLTRDHNWDFAETRYRHFSWSQRYAWTCFDFLQESNKKRCLVLLDEYRKNPARTREKWKIPQAYLFAFLIFLCDDFLTIKDEIVSIC